MGDEVEIRETKRTGDHPDLSPAYGTDTSILESLPRIPVFAATIVVPAYNEEAGIAFVLERLSQSVDGRCEVLVIDDGSSDATARIASSFRCRVIRHRENRGKGEAMKTGLRFARGKCLVFIDADGTYPADVIPQMVDALDSYDVVYCPRSNGRENIPLANRFGNAIFQGMMRYIYGFRCRDYCTGLYGLRKTHLQKMGIMSRGFAIEPEIGIKATRMKLRMRDIPIEYKPRMGKAKLSSFKAGFEHLKIILKLLFWQPERPARRLAAHSGQRE